MNLPAASVRRLHLRTATPGRTGPLLRRALGASDLEAPGLPPSAILVVRRLEAPPWSAGRDGRVWSAGLQDALGVVARRAARPMRGGSSEEAVWFADMAELLACLALDAALGRAPWWWEGLDRPLRPATWARAWLEQIEHLPGAVAHLEREGLVRPVLGGLGAAEAMALVSALRARFGLPATGAEDREDNTGISSSHINNVGVTSVIVALAVDDAPAPWAAWTSSTQDLPPVSALLVGVALGLIRAPAALRSPAFARAVRRWLALARRARDEVAPPREGGDASRAEEPPRARTSGAEPVEAAPEPPRTLPTAGAQGSSSGTARPAPRREGGATPAVRPRPGPPIATAEETARQAAEDVKAGSASNDAVTYVTRAPAPRRELEGPASARATAAPRRTPAPPVWTIAPADPAPADSAPALALPIATRLGGAFYLVNVGILLGLYGDFTRPAEPGIDLPIFDWVARVARGLWPEAPAEDALWPLLQRLAWGSEEPEIQALPPLPEWRVRPEWPPRAADEAPDPSLEAWLARLLPALGERLARAMPELPPARWLAQPGLVLLSSARVEVIFSLDTHPIELRIAGLDRDPGWVPAAGHTLLFRYQT